MELKDGDIVLELNDGDTRESNDSDIRELKESKIEWNWKMVM